MPIYATLAFVLIVLTSMTILIFRDWRIVAIALAVQYLAAFALVTLSWPLGMSLIKLIVGWMATAAIALTCLRQENDLIPAESTASLVFRGLAGLLVILVISVVGPTLQENMFPRLPQILIQSGLMLLGMSMMQMGTNSNPYLTIVSLLSFLSGFEIIHAGLELSTLLTGLMVMVNLGLSLVGIYFISTSSEDESLVKEENNE